MDHRRAGLISRPALDVDGFLYRLKDEAYVLIKSFDLDRPAVGSDLDIVCADVAAAARAVLSVAERYAHHGYEVRARESRDPVYAQIDLLWDGRLMLRFDLMERIPPYPRVRLKPGYFSRLIQDRRSVSRRYQGRAYRAYTAAPADDLLLRYVEYAEYFHSRSDKVKHLHYVLKAVEDEAGMMGFLDRLHRYTNLPSPRKLSAGAEVGGWRQWLGRRVRYAMAATGSRVRRLRYLTVQTLRHPWVMTGKLVSRLRPARETRAEPMALPRVAPETGAASGKKAA